MTKAAKIVEPEPESMLPPEAAVEADIAGADDGDALSGADTPAVDEIDAFDIKVDSLSGDIRDAMLMQVRQMRRPWEALVEAEQREVANIFDSAAKTLVRKVVHMITDVDFPRCVVTLGEVKIKGEKGIEAKISCMNHAENRATLGEYVGQMVLLLMVDSDDFLNERAPAPVVPDQGVMPIEALEPGTETPLGKVVEPTEEEKAEGVVAAFEGKEGSTAGRTTVSVGS